MKQYRISTNRMLMNQQQPINCTQAEQYLSKKHKVYGFHVVCLTFSDSLSNM